jgi:endo-1,4-beta-xylanase
MKELIKVQFKLNSFIFIRFCSTMRTILSIFIFISLALINLQERAKSRSINNTAAPISDNRRTIREIMSDKYPTDSVFVGATLGYKLLGGEVEKLFLREFSYCTPENAAKQRVVHPEPDVWNWERIDSFVSFAAKNNIVLRLHGPIGPQCSIWAETDNRTAAELEKNMTEFMTALCQRFNGNKNVLWMDVVNETVERDGSWHGDKPGVGGWENPWVKMGYNDDPNGTPLYIIEAFKIATENAPDIKLIYNQNYQLQEPMWEKVKSTILYLRSLSYRVDGVGWQAHLSSRSPIYNDPEQLSFLSDLIDWAHANSLEFHITEIDCNIENLSDEELILQAQAYSNVLKVLLSKRHSGVIAFNSWGLTDRYGPKIDKRPYMFDENLNPKPAYFAVKDVLENYCNNLIFSPELK